MGDPITKYCTILASTDYTFLQNVSINIKPSTTLIQYTYEASPYYENVAVSIPNVPQMIDVTTHRQLTVPNGILPLYQYALGDIGKVIQFGECSYNQSCSDLSITYSVMQQNGSAIPSEAMIFSSSSRKLIISTLNATLLGTYNLKFKCIIPDGFMNSKDFTVEIVKELTITEDSAANTTDFQPNYAPEFLQNLINKWTIRAGSAATFTLPDYYDINPTDKVSVSLQTAEKHRNFFRIKDNKFIVFSAGFPELGDIEMIISLTDDHKPTPKTTKYRLTVSIMQSPFGQMQNDYVQQVNVSSSTKPQVFSFNSDQGVKVQAISPEGIVKINFEKSLNLTNITNATQEIQKAIAIKFDDPLIKDFSWTITDLQNYSLQLKISFNNPLLISQDQAGTFLQIILLNPSLFDSFDIKEDYPSYDENFRNFGYDSSLAIQNMGFNTFILLMSPLLVIFALIFMVFSIFIPKILSQHCFELLDQHSLPQFKRILRRRIVLYISSIIYNLDIAISIVLAACQTIRRQNDKLY
eukprot:403363984